MSREIKFRQWEPISQKFTYWGCMGDGEFRSPTTSNGVDLPTVHQQMTGLKDKNGVEIYEGDIVKYQLGRYIDEDGGYGSDNYEMFDEVSQIVYDDSKGRFKRKDRFHDFIDSPVCEIIGNIYENKELLNDQQ